MKFRNKLIREILERYKTIDAIQRLSALAAWDLNTYMPQKSAEDRGIILGKADVLVKKLILDKEFVKLINKAEKEKNLLNDYEKAVIKILKKRIKILSKLPDKFIEEFNATTNKAQIVWKNAKENNNFKEFLPYIKKIFDLVKKQAEYLGYKEHPYDALIDLYEESWTTEDFENFFNSIKDELKKLFEEIKSSKNYIDKHLLEKEPYRKEDMEKVNFEVLKILNFDQGRSRLDIAPHPFEESISLNDVRITTWYHKKDFRRSLSATIHEFGHSLYELNIDPELKFTPLQRGTSYGLHESQSRFWENIIGRNVVFLEKIWPICKKHLSFLKKYKFKDFYIYFNLIRPEFIRVESDEITYHFHIILRFELEKMILENKVKIKEAPEYWNEFMKTYLGIKPKTYKEGILQDIHWSMGAIGYFPTYSLGTFLTGMWLESIEKNLGNLEKILEKKEGINLIQNWLKDNIHKYGKTYTSKDLIYRICKKEFTTWSFLNYLRRKYLFLYKN
jgi:carboxypeptidase Taq